MTYYPAWFDDVAWSLMLCGVVCFVWMKGLSVGQKRGLVKLSACVLVSTGMAFAGTAGVLLNLRAPHLSAQGKVSNVVIHSGKGSSTTFSLADLHGPLDGLHISGAKPQIEAGEDAEVIYQAQSMLVLNLHIADGPNAGFENSESNGGFGAAFAILAALVLACYGVVNFRNDGTAIPNEIDNGPAPPGDADPGSMLNL